MEVEEKEQEKAEGRIDVGVTEMTQDVQGVNVTQAASDAMASRTPVAGKR